MRTQPLFFRVTHPFLQLSCLLLGTLFFPYQVNAQFETFDDSWRWVLFTTESGLPSNQVYDIVETASGTVWAATRSGVTWYDGFRWHPVPSPPEMQDKRPIVLAPYGDDEVVTIINNELFHVKKNSATHIPTTINGKADQIYSAVQFGKEEVLLLGTGRLLTYHNGVVAPFHSLPSSKTLTDGHLNLWKTRKGDLWLNTSNGLYRLDNKIWTKVLRYQNSYYGIKKLVQSKSGTSLAAVILPTQVSGIWEWGDQSIPTRSLTERSASVLAMDIGPNNEIIVAYESGEVRVRHKDIWSSLDPLPPAMANILFLQYRDNGDLWVGTEKGLYLHRRSSNLWTRWTYPFPDLRNSVHEIYQTSDGSIWLGTMRGLEIRRPNGKVEWVEKINGQPLNLITGIVEDGQHNVWICSGASFEGAYRWDGKTWVHFGEREGLHTPRIHKIRKDRQGRLWFLGLGVHYENPVNQPGAFLYDKGKFIRWGEQEGLPNGRVYGFEEHPDGAYWFATFGGLSRWKGGTWTHWTSGNGLPYASRIPVLAIDPNGVVWFSDQRAGLGYIDENDKARFLSVEHGLVNNEIWDLRFDDEGVLWISTRGGLSSYHKGIFTTFTIQSGLNTLRLWELLPLKDKIFIGSSSSGVNILNRGSVNPPPRVEISKPVIENDEALIRWHAFTYWAELPHEAIESRYRVDGGSWSTWATLRELSLTELKPGSHTVEVQAKGFFGNFNPVGQKLSFLIEPHMYQRPQYFLPIGVLSLAFIILGVTHLNRKRKQDAALRASENRYRVVVEDQTELICRYLPDGPLTFVNEAYCRFFAKTRHELIGSNIKTFFPEREGGSMDAYLASFTREQQVLSYERIVIPPSGELRWQHWTDRAIYDAHGHITEFQAVGRDITERKQAENLLHDRIEQLQTIYYLTDAVSRAETIEEIYTEALDALGRSTKSDRVAILLFEQDTKMHFKAWRGLSEKYRRAVNGHSPWQPDVKNPQPVLVPNVNEDSSLSSIRFALAEEGIQSLAFIPLIHHGKLLGKFTMYYNAPHQFGDEVQLAQTIAYHIAFAIERTRTQEALRESEERYRQAIVQANAVPYEKDYSTNSFVFISSEINTLTGYAPSELTREIWKGLIQEIVMRGEMSGLSYEKATQRALTGEIAQWQADYRIRTRNGDIRWLSDSSISILDQTGKPTGSLGILQDITERKMSQQVLEEERTLLRTLVEALPDEFALKDTGGRFLIVNHGAVRALGAGSAENLIGKTDFDFVKPHLAQEQFLEEQHTIKTRQPIINKELSRIDTQTGQIERCILVTKIPLFERSGNAIGLMTINRDITERKYAEVALRESEERFRKIFEEGPIGMALVDQQYRFVKVNSTLCALLGYTPDELVQKTFFDVTHPDDINTDQQLVHQLLEGELPHYNIEKRYIRRGGEIVWVNLTASLVRDNLGNVVYGLAMIENITERKQAEQTLRELSKRILEAQESERRRVSRELHDSVIQILASVKFRMESVEEQAPSRSVVVKKEVARARRLLDKVMLEVRRISRNLRPSELDDLGLAAALRSLLNEFAERTGINVALTFPKQTSSLPSEVELTLYRIIQEAVANVEKHAKASKVNVVISLQSSTIVASIHDNGKGFSPAKNRAKRSKQSGMGLVDMKERLTIIGGTFEVASAPRKGTAITVHIPFNGKPE